MGSPNMTGNPQSMMQTFIFEEDCGSSSERVQDQGGQTMRSHVSLGQD